MMLFILSDLRYTPPGDLYNIWLVVADNREEAIILIDDALVDAFEIGRPNFSTPMIMLHKQQYCAEESRVRETTIEERYRKVSTDSEAHFDRVVSDAIKTAMISLPNDVCVDELYVNTDRPEAMFVLSGIQFGTSRGFCVIDTALYERLTALADSTDMITQERITHVPVALSWQSRLSLYIDQLHDQASIQDKLQAYKTQAYRWVHDASDACAVEDLVIDADTPAFTVVVEVLDGNAIHARLDVLGAPRQLTL